MRRRDFLKTLAGVPVTIIGWEVGLKLFMEKPAADLGDRKISWITCDTLARVYYIDEALPGKERFWTTCHSTHLPAVGEVFRIYCAGKTRRTIRVTRLKYLPSAPGMLHAWEPKTAREGFRNYLNTLGGDV